MRLRNPVVEARHAAQLNAHRIPMRLILGNQILEVLHLDWVTDLHLELPLRLAFVDLDIALRSEHPIDLQVIN